MESTMFSQNFIEKAHEEVSKNNSTSPVTVKYGPINFLVTKKPLKDKNQGIFQGHIGEGDSLFFVYLQ